MTWAIVILEEQIGGFILVFDRRVQDNINKVVLFLQRSLYEENQHAVYFK